MHILLAAEVYLASDFEDTASYMRDVFECHAPNAFALSPTHISAATFAATPAEATLQLLQAARELGAAAPLPYPHTHPMALEASVRVAREGLRPEFQRSWDDAGWLVENPVGSCTEREAYVELHTRDRLFRVMLVRR